jgi:multisubunit Na+/H+ antiporter MnhG subunit
MKEKLHEASKNKAVLVILFAFAIFSMIIFATDSSITGHAVFEQSKLATQSMIFGFFAVVLGIIFMIWYKS